MKHSMPSRENGFSVKLVFFCMKLNIRKWVSTPRIPVLCAAILAFGYGTTGGVEQVANRMGMRVSPWLLPHFFANPLMMCLFGFFTLFFYCNAPFFDRHSSFVMIRTGRNNWIWAQILYIIVSSVLYTLVWFLASLLPVLPRLSLTADWGDLLYRIADGTANQVADQYGISLTYYVSDGVCRTFTGPQATLLSLLLLWLVTLFIGMLVFCFNLISGYNLGVIATGVVSFMALFVSSPLVLMFLGEKPYYISPVSWCSLYSLDFAGTGRMPGVGFAIIVLIFLSVCFICVSVQWFRRMDVSLEESGLN